MTTVYHFCEFCKYRTIVKCNLKRHQNSKHKEEFISKNTKKGLIENVSFQEANVSHFGANVCLGGGNVSSFDQNVSQLEKNENYTCEKCNKIYNTKKYYLSHVSICNGIDKLTCPRCMISFTTRSAKSKHIKNNKCKPRSIIHAREPNTNSIITTQKIRTQNNITNNTHNTHNTHNTNNTNNTNSHNTINNIYINNYGKERMDYLTYEKILHIYKKGYNIPSALIEAIHFNKDFPENNNIKYIDKYTAHIKVDDDFISRNMNTLIYDMMNKKIEVMINLLQLYGEKLKEDVDKLTYEDIEDILNNYLAKLPKEKYKEQFYKTRDICKNYTDKNCE